MRAMALSDLMEPSSLGTAPVSWFRARLRCSSADSRPSSAGLGFHLEDAREAGDPVPEPSACAATAHGYAVVIEQADAGCRAWAPDLPDGRVGWGA